MKTIRPSKFLPTSFASMFAMALLLGGPAQASLIAHWTLDDGSGNTTVDASGNHRDGVRNSGAWITTAPPAKVGGALEFAASGAGVSANMGAGVLPIGNAERTITAWVRSDVFGDRKFFGYGGAGAGVTFDWTVEGSGVWLRHGGGQVKWDFGYTLGELMHLALVVPAGAVNVGDVDLFIDGAAIPVSSINNNAVLNTGANDFFNFGRGFSAAAFDGVLDDVQVYDNALSLQQVDWLFNNPGLAIPEPSSLMLTTLGFLVLIGCGRLRKRA